MLWSLAVAGAAAAAVTMALALASDHADEPALQASLLDAIILSYVSSGVIAWWRRPDSRFGPLMIVAGLVIALTATRWANAGLPYTVGWVLDLVPAAVFLHVYLAFPTGRLERRRERRLVVTAYATALGLQIVGVLLGGFGPGNVLAVVREPKAAETLLRVQLVILSAVMLAGVGVLAARRVQGGRPARRWIALLVDSFAVALVMIAVLFVTGLFHQASAVVSVQRVTFVVLALAPIAFLLGLLHARLARSAVAELVVELRTEPGPAELRDALSRALRDPSLTLLYWLPEFEGWADADGHRVQLPEADASQAITVIDHDSAHVAALVHDPVLDDEPELLDAVAAAAALALDNSRLQVELGARVEDLQRSRARLVEAGDSERRRLERNLHDGAQQRLVAIGMQLRLLQHRIREDPATAEQLATTASDELASSLDELRELARGIHPAVLDHGLEAALDSLASRSPVRTELAYEADGPLTPQVELAAYFVVSEALTNVAKYARARAATVRVARADATLMVEIADDGVGGADANGGSGLRGLADRVEALDGRLHLSSRPGAGTVVIAEIPCGS